MQSLLCPHTSKLNFAGNGAHVGLSNYLATVDPGRTTRKVAGGDQGCCTRGHLRCKSSLLHQLHSFTLTVKHFLPIDNAFLSVEQADDLSPPIWASDQVLLVSNAVNPDGYATSVFRSSLTVPEDAKLFMRVRVTLID